MTEKQKNCLHQTLQLCNNGNYVCHRCNKSFIPPYDAISPLSFQVRGEQKPYYADLLDLVSEKNNNMLRVMFDPEYMLHVSVHESPNENGHGMYISKDQAVLLQSLLNRHLSESIPTSSTEENQKP